MASTIFQARKKARAGNFLEIRLLFLEKLARR
jgi:hypothetical protein